MFIIQPYKTYGNWGKSSYKIEFKVTDKNLEDFDKLINNDTFNVKFRESRNQHVELYLQFHQINGYDSLKKCCELQDKLCEIGNVYDAKDANKVKYKGFNKDADGNYVLNLTKCDVPEKFIQDFYQVENLCKNANYINMHDCNIDTKNVEFFTDINKVIDNKRTSNYLYIRYSEIESIKGFTDKERPEKLDINDKVENKLIKTWYKWPKDDLKGVALSINPNSMDLFFVKSDKKDDYFYLSLYQNNKESEFCKNLGI